jgi:pimeloyl-ACP methyl ester carboxylesterase
MRSRELSASDKWFVGRVSELAAIRTCVDAVSGGAGRMVWVEGDPGSGKTALVNHVVAELPAAFVVLRAAADESTVDKPFAVLVCDPAQPDMGARIPGGLAGKIAAPAGKAQMRMSADRAEFFGARMAAHDLDSIEKYFTELRRFSMLPLASQITCPTLIIEAEHDFADGGGQTLIDALAAPSQLPTG